jgi:hypothetical protein
MQLYCLTLREDLIQALVSKEHTEEQLKSENLFLREQLRGEQMSKENLEESFTQENELLNTTLESRNMALGDYKKRCAAAEQELDALKSTYNKLQSASMQRISELEHQNEDLSHSKVIKGLGTYSFFCVGLKWLILVSFSSHSQKRRRRCPHFAIASKHYRLISTIVKRYSGTL